MYHVDTYTLSVKFSIQFRRAQWDLSLNIYGYKTIIFKKKTPDPKKR